MPICNRTNIYSLLCWFSISYYLSFANGPIYPAIFDPAIRTVQFYRGNNEFAFPFLHLNENNVLLTLEFDELKDVPGDFQVTFLHCGADWVPDQLLIVEFFEGILNNRILDFRHSQNTKKSFTHYRFQFPQPNTRFKISGNYILKVFKENDEAKTVLTRRFLVVEEKVVVTPNLGMTMNAPNQRMKLQAVNFNVVPNNFKIFDPVQEMQVHVLQNFRWDNMRFGLRPTFLHANRYEYAFDAKNDYPGGNEYRRLDLRSMRRHTGEIDRILWADSAFFVEMMPEKPRTGAVYLSNPDFNGAFFIGQRETVADLYDFESDYCYVTFKMQTDELPDNDIYVFGQLSDWQVKTENKMRYRRSRGYYEVEILLKQGIYDYQYVTTPRNTSYPINETQLEGSYMETENYYTIIVYYRGMTDRYDRLIGLKHINFYE
jgi:hypothetical protein